MTRDEVEQLNLDLLNAPDFEQILNGSNVCSNEEGWREMQPETD